MIEASKTLTANFWAVLGEEIGVPECYRRRKPAELNEALV